MPPRTPDESATLTGRFATVATLPPSGAAFRLEPDATALETLRAELDLIGLRKLRFTGRLDPAGGRDWRLTGQLGATVVQPCTVTLAPVTTRVEEPVERLYLAHWSEPEAGTEIETPQDDAEPLPREIDLAGVMAEALALALPLYPRAEDADFDGAQVTEAGQKPMADEDAKPFAGLAALRDRMGGDTDD